MIEKVSSKSRGGARPGAGRPKGVANKLTAQAQAETKASGITPLEYMLSVMRAPETEPRERLVAAQAAAPYVHAKLSAITVAGDAENPVASTLTVKFG